MSHVDNLVTKYTEDDKKLIRAMLPTKNIHDGVNASDIDDMVKKNKTAIHALYMAFKQCAKETKKNYVDTLKEFGYNFEYDRQRDSMRDIIAHGIMVFMQNNMGFDSGTYESSCPENLEEWYYEFARLCDCGEKSEDAVGILVQCCFLNGDLTTMDHPFSTSIEGRFAPDLAINLFILENLSFESSAETAANKESTNAIAKVFFS